MSRLLSTVVAGLGNGSVYALLALGFVIIYKSMGVISLAQPALMVVGGTAVAYLAVTFGLNFYLAVLLAIVLTAGVALVVERLALRPMIGEPPFVIAIITIGVDIVLRIITNRFIGIRVLQVGDPWGFKTLNVGGVAVQHRYLAMMIATGLVVALLMAFFTYSRIGLAMRATAFDQETSRAMGISVSAVFALSWAIAGGLAALAGTFVGAGGGIDTGTWVFALKALPAIILGGLDSLGGAVVGGLAIGVIEALVGTYQGQYAPFLGNNFAVVSPYVVMLIVLLVRPYGLFGTPEVERA
jgi:branched-chain amino acid transport system permease protein